MESKKVELAETTMIDHFKCVDPPYLDKDGIFHFDYYHPRRGGTNPKHKGYSAQIMTLKEHTEGHDYDAAMKSFTRLMADAFSDDCAIVVVPSSNQNKTWPGIRQLACRIAAASGSRMDATTWLVRHKSVRKAAWGGDRDIGVHLDSMRTADDVVADDRPVIVLDDIVTSGNSLLACRKLLVKAGVRKVVLCAVLKTVSHTPKRIL